MMVLYRVFFSVGSFQAELTDNEQYHDVSQLLYFSRLLKHDQAAYAWSLFHFISDGFRFLQENIM